MSKHLRVLSGAGLIEHRSIGTRNLYALAPGGLAAVQQWLAGTWAEVVRLATEDDGSVVAGLFTVAVQPWRVTMTAADDG